MKVSPDGHWMVTGDDAGEIKVCKAVRLMISLLCFFYIYIFIYLKSMTEGPVCLARLVRCSCSDKNNGHSFVLYKSAIH